jgi:midasin (ATPase involved in ribosome maturation)
VHCCSVCLRPFATQVLLENLDKPDQSVTERLNGSLEVEVGPDMAVHRVLCVSEAVDGTADGGAPGGASSSAATAAGAIVLQPGFAVFATVHATESEALALSPATRSRFTEIWCPAYDKEDMMQVRAAGVSFE